MNITTHPLTADRFSDLEQVFSAKGCSFARDCWCMGYRISGRLTPPDGTTAAEERRSRLRALAGRSPSPGLIGYDAEGAPVGWVSVAPRETYARLQRSPVMKPVDDMPVWSVVCFVVAGPARGQGVARLLLDHAVAHAEANGAMAVEGYPVDKPTRSPPQFLWHGAKAMFDAAGFVEIARRKPERPVMRRMLTAGRPGSGHG